MNYCPPNITLSTIWINNGVSPCFLDTVTSSIILAFIVLFGLGQLRFYRKYATRVGNLQKCFLFKLQVSSHILLIFIDLAQFIVRGVLSRDGFLGFQILYLVSAITTWPICLAVLMSESHYQLPKPPSHGHGFVLLTAWSAKFVAQNLAFLSMDNEDWWFNVSSAQNKVAFGLWVVRYIFTFIVFLTGMKAPGILTAADIASLTDTEALINGAPPQAPTGGPRGHRSASSGSTWSNFFQKFKKLVPYMWPKESIRLQLHVVLSLVLLIGVRITNVYVPILSKDIVNGLAGNGTTKGEFVWALIVIFVTVKFIQGGGTGAGTSGLLNLTRSFLWISVQQDTERKTQIGLFAHLQRLSLRWHLSRKTGEVLRIMDRGTQSISSLLNYLIFSILPTLVDIIIAVTYFSVVFNLWFGLIVLLTMIIYLTGTVMVTEWRTKFRRRMNEADNKQRSTAVDSLLNFETVKYYGAEQYEVDKFDAAIKKYQKEEWVSLATLNFLNMFQCIVINISLLGGSLYSGYLISTGEETVGDYVLFGTYMLQLMVPLNWLGSLYRIIQESFINMENMLDLLDEPIEILDIPNALPLIATKGKIEFKNVSFYYSPERPIIKDISFTVLPGETYAIVGPTGAGKSTIMRLLFRFYDVQEGSILIDHQNIKEVTQVSLRQAIGVVPQDTVLFNDTIGNNIRYARPEARIEEVMKNASLAEIHEQIMRFTDGYDTVVGERGLKLSGGEKQRVAIARTLLKAPTVVLLDEATSALDSQTERNIQAALMTICVDRTTLIIAHRLSTITHANCILVLKDGEIVERGRHEELLSVEDGLYSNMWRQQSQVNNNDDGVESSD